MKKGILFLALLITCLSCNNDDDNNDGQLVSKWQLIEVLSDPGDGSGTFITVESSKTINFYVNGTFTSNENICNWASETVSIGTFTSENEIIVDGCNTGLGNLNFNIVDEHLILSYACIEACLEKYVRID